MRKYNNIDSIGTEYSTMSPFSPLTDSLSDDLPMLGGGVNDILNGITNGTSNVLNTLTSPFTGNLNDVTEKLMNAIDNGNLNEVKSIIHNAGNTLKINLEKTDRFGNNILHKLSSIAKDDAYAKNLLKNLIRDAKNFKYIDVENRESKTPLMVLVESLQNTKNVKQNVKQRGKSYVESVERKMIDMCYDVIREFEKNGASKNNGEFELLTDRDDSVESISVPIDVKSKPQQAQQPIIAKQNASIFGLSQQSAKNVAPEDVATDFDILKAPIDDNTVASPIVNTAMVSPNDTEKFINNFVDALKDPQPESVVKINGNDTKGVTQQLLDALEKTEHQPQSGGSRGKKYKNVIQGKRKIIKYNEMYGGSELENPHDLDDLKNKAIEKLSTMMVKKIIEVDFKSIKDILGQEITSIDDIVKVLQTINTTTTTTDDDSSGNSSE
jgi:hypothetical protein